VILWEGDPTDPTRKPPEMYTLVENFCLGLRRIELFARARSLRRGWVSVLAEGEEAHVPAVQALRAGDAQLLSPEQFDGGTNVLGQELSVDRAERWDQDKWEAAMRAWLQNGRTVVPMTPGTCPSVPPLDHCLYERELTRFGFFSRHMRTCAVGYEQRSTRYDQSRPCAAAMQVVPAAVQQASNRAACSSRQGTC